MCYEASRMPMQPDRFSDSQTVSAPTPSLLWRVLLGCCLSASVASGGLAVYETTKVRQLEIDSQNLRRQILQLEGIREELLELLQEPEQPVAPGPVPSNSVSSPTKTNEKVYDALPTEKRLIEVLRKHGRNISILKNQSAETLILKNQLDEKLPLISEIKGRADVHDSKIGELGTQAAGIKTMTEQMNRKIPELELHAKTAEEQLKKNSSELETRVGKCENLIKAQIQSLNALRLSVEARSTAKAKSTL